MAAAISGCDIPAPWLTSTNEAFTFDFSLVQEGGQLRISRAGR